MLFMRAINRAYQITLPAEFYKKVGLQPKDRVHLVFDEEKDILIIKPVKEDQIIQGIL